MKAKLASCSTLCIAILFCQISQGSSPASEKKPYYNVQTETVFWPLENPFWVRIAQSPDSGESFPLWAINDSAAMKKGVKLDFTGNQHIRWYNDLEKKAVIMRFVADGEPPKCRLTFNRPAEHRIGGSPCFSQAITGTIDARDRHSGVKQILASLGSNALAPVQSDTVTFTSPGEYRFHYCAVDNVGNTSAVQSTHFFIDMQPPRSSVLSKIIGDGYFAEQNPLVLGAVDSVSGVRAVFWRVDNNIRFAPYLKPISLQGLGEGTHRLQFHAVDNVGNVEPVQSFSFAIDKTGPTSALVYEGPVFPEQDPRYVSTSTRLRFEARDSLSGVDSIWYSFDEGPFIKSTGPVSVSTKKSGVHAVSVRSVDKVGNLGPAITRIFELDRDAPIVNLIFEGKFLKQGVTTFITPQTKVIVHCEDNQSGVGKVAVRINDGSPAPYSGPLLFSQEGQHTIAILCHDNVGNADPAISFRLVVDSTPPEIVKTFSTQGAIGASPTGTVTFRGPVTLSLGATDNFSGTEAIFYSINNGAKTSYNKELRFDSKGKYAIVMKAIDRLGFARAEVLSLKIE